MRASESRPARPTCPGNGAGACSARFEYGPDVAGPGSRADAVSMRGCNPRRTSGKRRISCEPWGRDGGRRRGDESERQRAESQWIVAARPLCHLQYPVAYLSRLQRILPAARWKLRFKEARAARPSRGLHLRHVPLGA